MTCNGAVQAKEWVTTVVLVCVFLLASNFWIWLWTGHDPVLEFRRGRIRRREEREKRLRELAKDVMDS